MRNIVLLLVLFLLFQFNATAQSNEYKHTLTLNTGSSVVGEFVNFLDGNNLDDIAIENPIDGIIDIRGSFTGNTTPLLALSYDYALKDWFSLGVSGAYQGFEGDIVTVSYTRVSDEQRINISEIQIDINRINLSARALFHYGTKPRLDMYSGFRLGVTNWDTTVEPSDPALEEDLQTSNIVGLNPSIQFIPFALRGYVLENLGINFETGIGTPHWISFGLNYRF